MSYVGNPYKYDVFVSYPHAVEAMRGATTLREWSRGVTDAILEYVNMAMAEEEDGEKLEYYLDRDRAVSAMPLTDTLEDAIEKSAVLVILMSPFYKNWCLQELEWFFKLTPVDGRSFGQCVLLNVQNVERETAWPDLLRDKDGKRLLGTSLMDDDGLPRGYETFRSSRTLPDTNGLWKSIAIEIRDKLLELRKRRDAERSLAESKFNPWTGLGQAPPDDLLIYLEAEPTDRPIWSTRRVRLEAERAVVLPDEPLADTMADRTESVLSVYRDCDGLVLHRARPDDLIQPRIRRAFQDRRLLYQKERKAMPWAVLDEHPDLPLPGAGAFRVPRVSAKDDGWPNLLFQALGGNPAAPGSP